ncbi:hypothetical protein Pelo_15519 [Pelomyxa schiedti]|nr:hypothetical protein Pelo_15519 [Pelomyxa schiedti]
MSGIGLSRYGAPCSERVELYLASEFIVSVMGVVCVNIASILCVRQADSIHHGVEKMKKSHFRLIQVVLGLVEFCNMIFGSVFVFSTSTAKCDPLLWKMALGCLILQYLSFFLMFCCLGCVCCCASILIALGIANSPPAGTTPGSDMDLLEPRVLRGIQIFLGLFEFCNVVFGSVFVFSTSECDPLLWKMALGCLILRYLAFFLLLGCIFFFPSILVTLGIANPKADTTTSTAETASATPESEPLLHKDITMKKKIDNKFN